jgi:hypothetical protein
MKDLWRLLRGSGFRVAIALDFGDWRGGNP